LIRKPKRRAFKNEAHVYNCNVELWKKENKRTSSVVNRIRKPIKTQEYFNGIVNSNGITAPRKGSCVYAEKANADR
jgi:hypothetical protein